MQLEKGEKGTNLSAEYGVSKQQISDIRKNKEKIINFADISETSEGLKRKWWMVDGFWCVLSSWFLKLGMKPRES